MGDVVQMFGDAEEPNSIQAFQNCYDEAAFMMIDLSYRHNIDYDGAVIAIIASLLDEAVHAAPRHQSARDVLKFVKDRCSSITE